MADKECHVRIPQVTVRIPQLTVRIPQLTADCEVKTGQDWTGVGQRNP